MSDLDQDGHPAKECRTAARAGVTGRGPLRAAFLGFCLTVLMGSGAGYALALWNQGAKLSMQVTTETLPSPTLDCMEGSNAVTVTWVPQRGGVTSYVVTVTRAGKTFKTTTYQPTTTSETITAGGNYTYTVTVTAHYGTWRAPAVTQDGIEATVSGLLFLRSEISCP